MPIWGGTRSLKIIFNAPILPCRWNFWSPDLSVSYFFSSLQLSIKTLNIVNVMEIFFQPDTESKLFFFSLKWFCIHVSTQSLGQNVFVFYMELNDMGRCQKPCCHYAPGLSPWLLFRLLGLPNKRSNLLWCDLYLTNSCWFFFATSLFFEVFSV